MNIRLAFDKDNNSIEQLTRCAFNRHPHHPPGTEPIEHKIIQRLRERNELTLSLVAEDAAEVIGHISFSPITINRQPSNWFTLAPLSVTPCRQQEGIGSQLVEAGIHHMRQKGAEGLTLLGDPLFYYRFGFKCDPGLVFPNAPAEYFLVLPLHSDTRIPKGTVGFSAAFFEQ